LNNKEKQFCVALARRSIDHFLNMPALLSLSKEELSKVPKKLLEEKACFVTLMKHGELRGCIGHLEKVQALYADIIDNSVNAAFRDPRFARVERAEFPLLKIEVSILTDPAPLVFSGAKALIKKLRAGKDGLIITKGRHSATFLPSVWEELPKKEDFLGNLCLKAGLPAQAWKEPGFGVQRYETIKAKEN